MSMMDSQPFPDKMPSVLTVLFSELRKLEDRIRVLEIQTCETFNRVEQIEEWQELIDDKLEG